MAGRGSEDRVVTMNEKEIQTIQELGHALLKSADQDEAIQGAQILLAQAQWQALDSIATELHFISTRGIPAVAK